MRKFVFSDIHGFGNVYYSMMNYLDNLSKEEDIELYINGDLFDRGLDSADILLDIKKRIEDNKYKIIYLGGNHELLMYEFFRKHNQEDICEDWYSNGGDLTHDALLDALNYNEKSLDEVVNLIANLKIYHKFKERINDKPIVLVHAACPRIVKDNCNLLINEDSKDTIYCVWARKYMPNIWGQLYKSCFNRINRLGNKDYFTIAGHTPNNNKYGFEYNYDEKLLNINGGCGKYVNGLFKFNHFPLVEIMDNSLKILTFNSNNEIIYGNYYINGAFIQMEEKELDQDREYLNKDLKVKKLYVNEDGIVLYRN